LAKKFLEMFQVFLSVVDHWRVPPKAPIMVPTPGEWAMGTPTSVNLVMEPVPVSEPVLVPFKVAEEYKYDPLKASAKLVKVPRLAKKSYTGEVV